MKSQSVQRNPLPVKAHFAFHPYKPSVGYFVGYQTNPNEFTGLPLNINDWCRLESFMKEKKLAVEVDASASPFDGYLELTGIQLFAQHEQESFFLRYQARDPSHPESLVEKLYLSEAFCDRVRQAMRTGRLRRYDSDLASTMTSLTRLFKLGGGVVGALRSQ